MTRDEVHHLAALARIAVTDAEADAHAAEFDSILHYVEQVRAVSGEASHDPAVGALSNVLREDAVTHEPNEFSEALLAAAPARDGRYVHVKKILTTDDAG